MLGCAWTVYTNVFGASIYPSVNSAAHEAPVVKNSTAVAARTVQPAFNEIFASLEQRPLVMPAPENVANSLMFNERFAASAPQGELPRSVASAPVETTKWRKPRHRARRRRPIAAAKPAETAKPKIAAPATKLALNAPAATPKETEARTAEAKACGSQDR